MPILAVTSEYLARLDYDNLATLEQTLVTSLLTVAEELLEVECNRRFAQATFTDEVHDGNGTNSLFIKNPPINSLTDIDITYTHLDGTSETDTYDDDDFDYKSKTGQIRWKPNDFVTELEGAFPEGFQNIKVTYNGGFATTDQALTPIKYLIAEIIMELFDPKFNNDLLAAETIGQYSYRKVSDHIKNMTMSKKKILGLYKIRYV